MKKFHVQFREGASLIELLMLALLSILIGFGLYDQLVRTHISESCGFSDVVTKTEAIAVIEECSTKVSLDEESLLRRLSSYDAESVVADRTVKRINWEIGFKALWGKTKSKAPLAIAVIGGLISYALLLKLVMRMDFVFGAAQVEEFFHE